MSFIPFILESLPTKDLRIDTRAILLETPVNYPHKSWYLKMYNKIYLKTKKSERELQIGQKRCILFNQVFIKDLFATVLANDSIINNFQGLISLNRISINHLAHHFGLL